jgi:hypothetical protein
MIVESYFRRNPNHQANKDQDEPLKLDIRSDISETKSTWNKTEGKMGENKNVIVERKEMNLSKTREFFPRFLVCLFVVLFCFVLQFVVFWTEKEELLDLTSKKLTSKEEGKK